MKIRDMKQDVYKNDIIVSSISHVSHMIIYRMEHHHTPNTKNISVWTTSTFSSNF